MCHGMPGSETALELMSRALGDCLQDGIAAKLADDLYCGADSLEDLLENWRRVLHALHKCNLRLSPSKTVICPKSTTVLGWIWTQGSLSASPHRIATLSSCPPPETVRGLRSFIGKVTRKTVEFRDLREHNKLKMLRKMDDFQWDTITNGTTCPNEMINNFYNKIWPIFDECFSVIKTRVFSRHPPFLSPIVKHLLKLRKNAVNKRDNECSHRLQEKINKLIRVNQLKAVKQENKIRDRGSKRWWSLVNKITGHGNSEVPLSHIIDPKVMNEHFQTINTDPDYVTPQPLHIPDGTRVPELSVHTVCKLLLKQKRTTSGPDELPYWFWNTYAYDIAPVITTIFNTSIKLGIVPDEWKLANLLPIPKESPCIETNQHFVDQYNCLLV